jgi:hypothetical protein
MIRKDWVLDVPANALALHAFDTAGQATGATQHSLTGRSEATRPAQIANGSQHSKSKKRPFHGTASLASEGPNKRSTNSTGAFRKPTKVIRGEKAINMEKFLGGRPIMRDVLIDIDGLGVGEENMQPFQTDEFDHDMDDDFDPADFGSF